MLTLFMSSAATVLSIYKFVEGQLFVALYRTWHFIAIAAASSIHFGKTQDDHMAVVWHTSPCSLHSLLSQRLEETACNECYGSLCPYLWGHATALPCELWTQSQARLHTIPTALV